MAARRRLSWGRAARGGTLPRRGGRAGRAASSTRRSCRRQRWSPCSSELVRVVVADDSVLLREGIVRLLGEAGFEVVGQAGDADDLLRKVSAHKPDIAIVDIRMPPTNTDD